MSAPKDVSARVPLVEEHPALARPLLQQPAARIRELEQRQRNQ
jgi:hypothetical protein